MIKAEQQERSEAIDVSDNSSTAFRVRYYPNNVAAFRNSRIAAGFG